MLIDVAFPTNMDDPQFKVMLEQSWYLKGVMLADAEYRMESTFDPTEIEPQGTGVEAFWRGVLDTVGTVHMRAGGVYTYPRVELKGSYPFLKAFLNFLEEKLAPGFIGRYQVAFDSDGKMQWQIIGGFLKISGIQAQQVIALLYRDACVSRKKHQRKADEAVSWVSRKRQ